MKYELVENQEGSILKRTDSEGKVWWIPTDPANSDYQAYLASISDSNKAEEGEGQ
jgi:hypothetical protein